MQPRAARRPRRQEGTPERRGCRTVRDGHSGQPERRPTHTRHFVRYAPPLLDFLAFARISNCQLFRSTFTVRRLMGVDRS